LANIRDLGPLGTPGGQPIDWPTPIISGFYEGLCWGGTSSYVWVWTYWQSTGYDLVDTGAAVIR